MPTPPEPFPDLSDLLEDGDPTLARLVAHLDQALRPRPTPPALHATLDELLRQRASASPSPQTPVPATPRPAGALSRRAALKVGAAGMAVLLTLGHTTPALAAELARLAGDTPMTGARLAGILRAERSRWNELLAQVGRDRMEVPGVEGEWSMKELVAHLTWYERAVVDGARQVFSTGTFTRRRPAGLSMDDNNAQIAAESRLRPVPEVLAEADDVFSQLLALVAVCPEEILNDPRLLGLPDDIVPWMGIANNSYSHYRQHEQAVREWLNQHAGDA